MANSSDSSYPGSGDELGTGGTRTLTASAVGPTSMTIPWKPMERSRPEILTKSPNASGLFDAFRRRWILATALGLLMAFMAVVGLWIFLPAKYEVSAQIHISPTKPSVLYPTNDNDFESFKRTQQIAVKSRLVLDSALRNGGLSTHPFLKGIQDQITYLSSQLSVDYPNNSELMRILLKGDQKQGLESVVNAVVDAYIKEVVEKDKTDKRQRKDELERRYQVYVEQIKDKSQDIHTLAISTGTTDTATGRLKQSLAVKALDQVQGQVLELQRQLLTIEDEMIALQVRQQNVAGVPTELLDLETDRDPRLAEIDRQTTLIDSELSQLASRLPRPQSSPTYMRKKRDLEELKAKKLEIKKVVREELTRRIKLTGGADPRNIRSMEELEVARKRMASRLELAQADYKAQVLAVKNLDVNSTDLETKNAELAHIRAVATELGQHLERSNIESTAAPRIQIYERAKEPENPSMQAKIISMIFAGLVSLGLVALAVSRMEYESRKMSRPGDVTHELGLKHVGDVPSISGLRWGRILTFKGGGADVLHDAMAESIDSVRAAIVHKAGSIKGTPVLLVTSAAEGEGKSTVASRLAVSLANTGRRTLLIDGHLRDPQVHRTFNVPEDPGICDLLRDPDQMAQAIVRDTEIPNLSVLTAGVCDEESLLALARGGLGPIINNLASAYRFIVIDGAPVLTISDSLAFGEEANMALLSVRRDVSRIPRVFESAERLKAVGINVMGVVVNGVSS